MRSIWQCKCGHIEYDSMPEDCPNCLRVSKFTRIPENMVERATDEEVLAVKQQENEDDEEFDF